MQETYKIKDLEQIRLLADPLKLQLLRAFAESEKTTKQVAAELDESITKLYRHVDALHDAGLLEIVQETPKRGTVERTFRAIAQRFEADRSLFADDVDEAGINAIRDLLQAGVGEILRALAASESDAEDTVVVRLRCKGSPERIAELRQSLTEWIETVQCDVAEDTDDLQEVGALIAFYPLHDER
jgi:DNA-binding transcriptional ArsR family regulator